MTQPIRRALLSVSDKRGLGELAAVLAEFGVEILSTGGTAKALSEAGIAVREVSDYTGAPEILDGRVKTLHPRIHGGLLGRPTADHEAQMKEHDIGRIDLVVVNLYPFEETIAKPGIDRQTAIENIDIGGPSMLRSAAKNHERVAVLVDPDDYQSFAAELRASKGAIGADRRAELACKAFSHTAAYDAAIAAYLTRTERDGEASAFPGVLSVQYEKVQDLRYGENPHQLAAFYRDARSPLAASTPRTGLGDCEVLHGKALSYNNILDLDAALACCLDLEGPSAVVVKHTNPCGAASAEEGVLAAYQRARACDPVSSFGGIVCVNREIGVELARELTETFLECIVAPSYSDQAMGVLQGKKNLRLVKVGSFRGQPGDTGWALRSVVGGLLVQSADFDRVDLASARVVTKREPSEAERAALDFAWRVVRHVKSNAILFCKGTQTVAVGAGQMSRVDSAKIAQQKATASLEGAVVASDAFFPFRDGVDVLADAGAVAIVQPGGSVRDQEVIDAADEHGVAMIFTGMRHFRH